MFTTLLESRAPRTRRTGGTTFSALVHGALIAAGVTATQAVRPALAGKPQEVTVHIVPVEPRPQRVLRHEPVISDPATHPAYKAPQVDLVIKAPTFTPSELPPITTGPEIPPDRIGTGGLTPTGTANTLVPSGHNEIVDVAAVERAPSILGKPREPRYPSLLRESGTGGTVILRFVIDTLGRAEMGDLVVVESSHALFTDAVRSVLPDYRFTPGEVGGRKVRTMVQMPFSFSVK